MAASQPISAFRLPRWVPHSASTTKSELNSSSAVPKVTRGISKMGRSAGRWGKSTARAAAARPGSCPCGPGTSEISVAKNMHSDPMKVQMATFRLSSPVAV